MHEFERQRQSCIRGWKGKDYIGQRLSAFLEVGDVDH